MSQVLERAKASFRARLSEVRCIEVPEWGDESGPLRIYVRPATLKERDAIYRHVSAGSLEALVETLIQRARDEEGKPIFRPVDRLELMRHVDPDVIARVVAEINGDEAELPSVEDAEKN